MGALVTALRVLSSGVDSLYFSMRGGVEEHLVDALEVLKTAAQEREAPLVQYEAGPSFAVQPSGWGRFRYWLRSRDFDLFLTPSRTGPAAYLRLASAYLHREGAGQAAAEAEAFVGTRVLRDVTGPASPSRVDVYSDFQGWQPAASDLPRFVTRARARAQHFEPCLSLHDGRRFTGFRFGRDQLLARLYDKTHEIGLSGKSWVADLWQGRDAAAPVWRLEFQFRREVLGQLRLHSVGDALSARQALWTYGTEWLSLRTPTANREQRHWPLDPAWDRLAQAVIGLPCQPVVRERQRRHELLTLIRGFTGYATSLAAVLGTDGYDETARHAAPRLRSYLDARGTTFATVAGAKRARFGERP